MLRFDRKQNSIKQLSFNKKKKKKECHIGKEDVSIKEFKDEENIVGEGRTYVKGEL